VQRFCETCGNPISATAGYCSSCGKQVAVLAKTSLATGSSMHATREPEEKVLLDEDGIKVTTARFMVKDNTYSMAGITSVKTQVEHPSKIGPFVTIAFGGLGLTSSFSDHSGSALGLGAMGLAMLAVGIAWLRSSRRSMMQLFIGANGKRIEVQV